MKINIQSYLYQVRTNFPETIAFLRQHHYELWALFFISSIVNLLMLSPTLYMLQVFDRVMVSKSEVTLFVLTAIIIYFYFIQGVAESLRTKLLVSLSAKFDECFSKRLVAKYFATYSVTFNDNPTQLLTNLTMFRQWLTGPGAYVFLDFPWTPIYVGVMFLLHPILGWTCIAFMLILGVMTWFSSAATSSFSKDYGEEDREINSLIFNKLRNAEVIQAMGMLPALMGLWWQKQLQFFEYQIHHLKLERGISGFSKQMRILLQSLALCIAAYLFLKDQLSLGSMIVASLLIGRATSPIDSFVNSWRTLKAAYDAMLEVEAFLKISIDQVVRNLTPDFSEGVSLVDYSALTSDGKVILQDINLNFQPGMVYVILGGVGSGKTTLAKSILGVWPHGQGDIFWGKDKVNSVSIEKAPNAVGYLPQQINLLHGPVSENIARMGDIDSEAVIAAAQMSGSHDLITHLPKGYDTDVGAGGAYLSGGQRQRVALARAFYGNPRLIVLDEPNANLDQPGELILNRAIDNARKSGAIVIIISHRPYVIRISDYVVVMKSGKVDYFDVTKNFLDQVNAKVVRTGSAGNPGGEEVV